MRSQPRHPALVDMATARPHLEFVKVLAATGPQRNKVLPIVLTFAELGFHSFEPVGWFGLFMPAGVPAPITAKFIADASLAVSQQLSKGRDPSGDSMS